MGRCPKMAMFKNMTVMGGVIVVLAKIKALIMAGELFVLLKTNVCSHPSV